MSYTIRDLCAADFDNGFLEVLSQLSTLEGLTPAAGRQVLSSLCRSDYKFLVAVSPLGWVIGAATLRIDRKFIHNGGLMGYIEDVVTDSGCRKQGIASALIRSLLAYARSIGCYKVILDCSTDAVPFYRGLGFREHEIEMRIDL